MKLRLPPVWVVKCTEWPRNGEEGWHWRYYLSSAEAAYDFWEPARNWGGPGWIRSNYSRKLLREKVAWGDLLVCYQSDHEHYGRSILGFTQFASDGKEYPPGSGVYNCFDMIPPNDAFRLDPPLTIDDFYKSGCRPNCFGRGTQGTVFPVECSEFDGIVRAIGMHLPAQEKSLRNWLQRVCEE